ncbi:MAG: ferrous iron transport protein B, partial [Clostridia bacterium]|nr:ferrous iron transport protein B [Clostridia bacterium]
FERDEKVTETLKLPKSIKDAIEAKIKECEAEMDDDAESIITNQRYAYINKLVTSCVVKGHKKGSLTTSDKIDRIITNRWLALPIFAVVMFLVYYIAVTTVGTILTDFTNDVFVGEWIQEPLRGAMEGWGVAGWLVGLVVDGIVGGVGAVLGFVPQMIVLFIMLAMLEDCGYMARIAFIMDRIFRKFGLSGKSFIPMLIGSGCGVPGVMASRTIEQDRDRKMTIMTTTFIPCGAKMPIIGMIAAALFNNNALIATSAYFIGVAAIVISGIMLKKTKLFAGDPAPFVMELPAYHAPTVSNVFHSTWERGWSFIKRAGTAILLSSIVIWFASSYGWAPEAVVEPVEVGEVVTAEAVEEAEEVRAPGSWGEVEDMDDSILGHVGNAVAPIFKPLGFANAPSTVATVMGLVAKEEVVGVFGVLYGIDDDETAAADIVDDEEMSDEEKEEALSPIRVAFEESSGGHGRLAAFAFMIFNLLCAPCFAAMGAIKREMNNGKWTAFAIGYQRVFAYIIALIVYQIGIVFNGAAFGIGTVVAIAALAFLVYMLFRKNKYNDSHFTMKV